MYDSTFYAEQLGHELEARFASPAFQQRISYFDSLKALLLRQPRRERQVNLGRRVPEAVTLPF